MTTRITVDPITRIEGHLRIDVEVDNGKVNKAWSSGQMWRGIEQILIGRDPREAWSYTQPSMQSLQCARLKMRSKWMYR